MSASRFSAAGRGELLARYSADYGRLLEQQASNDRLRLESERRSEAQQALEHLRTHDTLTNLPNRILFNSLLTEAMEDGDQNHPIGLIHIDLNDFKETNNSHGYANGDLLLAEMAQRLMGAVGKSDLLARLGSDEYAVLHTGSAGRDEIERLVQRIIKSIADPFTLSQERIPLHASIGISLFPGDGRDVVSLHRSAKLAAQGCKEEGRSAYQFYDPALRQDNEAGIFHEHTLREALVNGEMAMVYQPQFDLETDEITGVEALIRWNHPEGGIVFPDKFIPAAERSGLINEIGEWVLRQACQQAVAWDAAGMPALSMGVNVSAAQFRTTDVVALVRQVLAETGLAPERLELEITETVVMRDLTAAADVLSALRDLGVKVAIDDFGIGYSALSYLRRLPVDKIKLDRSFIIDVTNNQDAAAVASTIVTLAHNLRLRVTAEGVETKADADFLRDIGCTYGQGYYYSRPVSPDILSKRFGSQ